MINKLNKRITIGGVSREKRPLKDNIRDVSDYGVNGRKGRWENRRR